MAGLCKRQHVYSNDAKLFSFRASLSICYLLQLAVEDALLVTTADQ